MLRNICTKYTGLRGSGVSGNYLLGNGYRGFNPVLKQFASQDNLSPFGAGGMHGYAYCTGNPVNRTDSSGHGPVLWLIFGMMGEFAADVADVTTDIVVTDTVEMAVAGRRAGELVRQIPLSSHRVIYQAPAGDSLVHRLELSPAENGEYLMRNIASGDTHRPEGIYRFVNRVDEPDVIRASALNKTAGHTSMTQLPQEPGVFPVNYAPLDVYYAGELVFEHGSLTRWTNASGHYKPPAELHSANLSRTIRRLLPSTLFDSGAARYVNLS